MIYEVENCYGSRQHYDTMLKAMDGCNIFTVEEDGGFFTIIEECDNCFEAKLTPDQLEQLGRELIDLANPKR
jgi:hypothetical protein